MNGCAVLTADIAPRKTIEEMEKLCRERIVRAFLRGAEISDWWDDFWHTIAEFYAHETRRSLQCSED